METVKVDMQKLQLLNDRIVQTIEALNQLRLSVHGIQHTSSPYGYGYGTVAPWGVYNPMTFAQPSFGPSSFGPSSFGYVPNGISHSTWEPHWQPRTSPWGFTPIY